MWLETSETPSYAGTLHSLLLSLWSRWIELGAVAVGLCFLKVDLSVWRSFFALGLIRVSKQSSLCIKSIMRFFVLLGHILAVQRAFDLDWQQLAELAGWPCPMLCRSNVCLSITDTGCGPLRHSAQYLHFVDVSHLLEAPWALNQIQ